MYLGITDTAARIDETYPIKHIQKRVLLSFPYR